MPRGSRSCGSTKRARGAATLGAESGKHLERMAVGLHEVPRLLDPPVGSDKEGRANHAFAASGPLAPRAIGLVRLVVPVTQQAHAKAVLLAERLMRGGVILRDPEHGDSEHLELREVVRELARLGGAARDVVLRIEVDDVSGAFEVLGGDDFAFLVDRKSVV